MKLKSMTLENFRGYKEPTFIDFNDMTVFIGPNDIGKSTILEALDIFFNDGKGHIKLDKQDVNIEKRSEGNEVKISLTFIDLPGEVTLDETNQTNLKKEYLLNRSEEFEIKKIFKSGSSSQSSIKTFIKAFHPTNPNCCDLLMKKNQDLKKIVKDLSLDCDKTKNAEMRAAIWKNYENDLQLNEVEIDVSKGGDIKPVWDKISKFLPLYSLFQSDRRNIDSDDEVQDPLKEAVKQILSDPNLQEQLSAVAKRVEKKLQEVSDLTLEKIKEMNPDVANSLHPNIPSPESLKWADVFKGLSISGDEDIPINKRGSGVRRLILLNFFRAEAEKRRKEKDTPNIIYAIEEPETSQHVQHQIILVNALKGLASQPGIQVVMTTHSSDIVKRLDPADIRLLSRNEDKRSIEINLAEKISLPYVSLNEINHVFFGDASEGFHNELYGFLQSVAIKEDVKYGKLKGFEIWLGDKGCKKTKNWKRDGKESSSTIQTYIRNSIHHPENDENPGYTSEELRDSIEKMREIAKSLPPDVKQSLTEE